MRERIPVRRHRIRQLRRGVYILPSLLTSGNIFCGFASSVMTFEREFHTAAILIVVAAILDGLDGRIARMTGATSEFGGEYDSLADVVSFGLAPAFLVHVWGLAPLRRYGWVIAFVFLVCGAIRLARFNIQHGASDRRWFVGLPIPMAASVAAGCVLCFEHHIEDRLVAGLFALVVLALSLLMVSRIRYRSFKDIDLRSRRPFRTVLPIVAMIAIIALHPPIATFLIASVYALSGPVLHVWFLRRGGWRPAGREAGTGGQAPAAQNPAEGDSRGGPESPAEVPHGAS